MIYSLLLLFNRIPLQGETAPNAFPYPVIENTWSENLFDCHPLGTTELPMEIGGNVALDHRKTVYNMV
jgi:hypothetical protein